MYSTGCYWQKECSYTRYRIEMTRSYTIPYTRFLVLKYTQIKEYGKGEVSYLEQHKYRENSIARPPLSGNVCFTAQRRACYV